MMKLERISEKKNREILECCSEQDKKFASKAFGLWKRFEMFEKNPPYAWVGKHEIPCGLCHVSVSPKRKYANLYYIQRFNRTKAVAKQKESSGTNFFQEIVTDLQKQGIDRIKLSSESEALYFWKKQGFWFWGFDKTGSLKADVPLLHRDKLIELRDSVVVDPGLHLPPEPIKFPKYQSMANKKPYKKIVESIQIVTPYYFPYGRYLKESTLEELFK